MIEFENLKRANSVFEQEYRMAFEEFLQSGSYILGDKLAAFEKAFADYCGTNYCAGIGSGLDAVKLSLEICAFDPGDEILVPANTFIATILAVLHCGLKPILVEPDINTYNIDCEKLEELITPKCKAIIPVHLYGKMADMDKIQVIAKKYNLIIIEDCAQAHGAEFNGNKAGSIGDLGAFSFYPVKNLGALGDGGAITTSSLEKYNLIQRIRNYGSSEKYKYEIPGYNSRLDELQAAFLLIKLKRLSEINEHKRSLANVYTSLLKDDFIKPVKSENNYDVFHIFPIRHEKRDNIRDHMLKNGIGTAIHYPIPPHRQNSLRQLFEGQNFNITDQIHSTILSLPISYGHTISDIQKVCEILNNF